MNKKNQSENQSELPEEGHYDDLPHDHDNNSDDNQDQINNEDLHEYEEDYIDENSDNEDDLIQHNNFDNKKKIIVIVVIIITIFILYKIFFSDDNIEENTIISDPIVETKEKSIISEDILENPEENNVIQIEEENIIEIRNDDILQEDNNLINLPNFDKIEFPKIPEPIIEEDPKSEPQNIIPDLPPMMDIPQNIPFNQNNINNELPPIEPPSLSTSKTRGVNMLAFGGNADPNQNQEGTGNIRDIAGGDVDGALNLFDQITGRYNQGDGFVTEHNSPETSSIPRIAATYYGDRNYIITQGKIFDAVLETAINTTSDGSGNEGMLRAVVTRDVYSDAGHNILIPRGTRLIGVYSNTQRGGKINIAWSRAIRPDGIDIAINSPGVDQIGRNGMQGIEDTKFIALIKNAILISGITVGGGVLGQKFAGDDGRIEANKDKDGNVVESGRIIDFAIRDAVNNLQDIFTNYVENNSDTATRVYVNQGTPLKVFITSDLVFSRSVSNLVREINKK